MSDPGLEIAKEAAFAAAAEFSRPAAELISNIFGVLGGDALRDLRKRLEDRRKERHAELGNRALKILQDRSVHEPVEPNAAAVDELAEAAQNEPRESLQDLWASLLAAMFDPDRAPAFRREFIEIARQLEPIDAAALRALDMRATVMPSRKEFIAQKLGAAVDDVELSFRNLERLGLIWPPVREITTGTIEPWLLPLGRRFLAAVE